MSTRENYLFLKKSVTAESEIEATETDIRNLFEW